LDAGDIISQREVPIEDGHHTGSMFEKLSIVGRDLLKETLPSIIDGTNERTPQDESKATFAHNITREQERIDWTKSARNIYNQIRGLHPWPTAYTTFNGNNVKIWWAKIGDVETSKQPGEVVKIDKTSFEIAAGDGKTVAILELQPAGKKRMSAEEFLRGTGSKLEIGDLFE